MCDFGYLALRVDDSFVGASPHAHVVRIAAAHGMRPRFVEPGGYLAKRMDGAHVVAAFFSGTCACDWPVERRRPLLSVARALASASDVAWVAAGFWSIRGDVNDGEPSREPRRVGRPELDTIDGSGSWVVALSPPSDASVPLREIGR